MFMKAELKVVETIIASCADGVSVGAASDAIVMPVTARTATGPHATNARQKTLSLEAGAPSFRT